MNNVMIILAGVIQNSVSIICWSMLAIKFDRWWIALFAVFFLASIKTSGAYKICDGCGKYSPYATNKIEAVYRAKEIGWVHFDKEDKDYCPECQANIDNMNKITVDIQDDFKRFEDVVKQR